MTARDLYRTFLCLFVCVGMFVHSTTTTASNSEHHFGSIEIPENDGLASVQSRVIAGRRRGEGARKVWYESGFLRRFVIRNSRIHSKPCDIPLVLELLGTSWSGPSLSVQVEAHRSRPRPKLDRRKKLHQRNIARSPWLES